MSDPRPYEARPHYPSSGRSVVFGWDAVVATLPPRPLVLALDGPEMLDWAACIEAITESAERAGRTAEVLDTHAWLRPWSEIEARTASPLLADDPDFDRLTDADMRELLDLPTALPAPSDVLLVAGPGAALLSADVVWYADLPKRYAEEAVAAGHGRNLGLPPDHGPATTRRLFYADWPMQDRHRDAIAHGIDLWIDAQDPAQPAALDGPSLRDTAGALARQPFRVHPTFRTVSWGGHWAQRTLGANLEARDSGIGYELIGPENGVLIGDDPDHVVELPFQLVVALEPEAVLGAAVQAAFGTSFPIRFDYLDTIDGGDLSVHCHPQHDYMQRVFGFPYAQHETYYVMVSSEGSQIMLGLRADADLERFRHEAHEAHDHGRPFDIFEYVQTHPADQHQLFAVPAGTPHGSGVGNVVLEISATPYLYSLRIYDWLRRDAGGQLRPVHIDHAFATLQHDHIGRGVAEALIQQPRTLRAGDGWQEELLYALPEVFYEVRRLKLDPGAEASDDTEGRFHVLNLVEGGGLLIELEGGAVHDLAYAETIVIPAAVGRYRVRSTVAQPVQVVKALVR